MARAHGSYPWCRGFESPSRYLYGILAQLGEHLPYKQRVTGSSPVGPTLHSNKLARVVASNMQIRRRGGTGRRAGLKILWWQHRTGSIPVAGIAKSIEETQIAFLFFMGKFIGSEDWFLDNKKRRHILKKYQNLSSFLLSYYHKNHKISRLAILLARG